VTRSSPRWVSRAKAAKIAGVEKSTINVWRKNGMIPASALKPVGTTGKRVRYDAAFFRAPDQVVAHV
jgi:predicted site-specific integrase-resolvase